MEQKNKAEMADCTFQPRIDSKSKSLMARRIQRLKITGTLHDHLYEDAKRREERYIEYANLVSPDVTFQPDIGVDKFRPPTDATQEKFFERLYTQKTAKHPYQENRFRIKLLECTFY